MVTFSCLGSWFLVPGSGYGVYTVLHVLYYDTCDTVWTNDT